MDVDSDTLKFAFLSVRYGRGGLLGGLSMTETGTGHSRQQRGDILLRGITGGIPNRKPNFIVSSMKSRDELVHQIRKCIVLFALYYVLTVSNIKF